MDADFLDKQLEQVSEKLKNFEKEIAEKINSYKERKVSQK